jgi:acetoin:2,6-dichlorophenolindophenol oxidoreductase subunit alpha
MSQHRRCLEAADANDIFAVYQAAARAVERARAGEGPTLIECKTYRWRAHTERIGQPDFRTEDEIAAWKKKDPIARLLGQLKAQGAITDADWQATQQEVITTIGGAVAFAEASPFPKPEQALEDMYAA